MKPAIFRNLALFATPLLFLCSHASAAKPDAYLHALATGADNHQLIVRLPMVKQDDGALVGVKGWSSLDTFVRDKNANLGYSPSQGYAWEVVGEYHEKCPTNYHYKLVRETDRHKQTKKQVSFLNSRSTHPKQQSLVVLSDGSFLFSCDRSHIHLRHPNRFSGWRPDMSMAPDNKIYDYPEISFDLKNLKTSRSVTFDYWNNNAEFGVSLAKNEVDNVVYASFEDQIYVFDLNAFKSHFHSTRHPFFHHAILDTSFERTPSANVRYSETDNHQKIVKSVHPEKARVNGHDWSAYFYLFNEFPVNPDFKGYSIISLAVAYQENGGRPFLFSSYATYDAKEAKTPVQMHWLQVDGRSEVATEEAPFGPALQFSRLVYTNGKPDSDDKGLKADITFLAADTDPLAVPVLGMHVHHNHPALVYHPYLNSKPFMDIVSGLGPQSSNTMYQMNPEILNDAMHSASTTQVNPVVDPSQYHLFKITNTGVNNPGIQPALADYNERLQPNLHSYYDRIHSREAIGKPPKMPMNHDVFLIRQGVYYFMPGKDDVTLSVFAQVLPAPDDNVNYGWANEPPMAWQEVARLPDMLERLEPNDPEQFRGNPNAAWWPGGFNWAAYSFDPVK